MRKSKNLLKVAALVTTIMLGTFVAAGWAEEFSCKEASTESELLFCNHPSLQPIDDVIVSPDHRHAIIGMHEACSATLINLKIDRIIAHGPRFSHRECFTYVGFSPDSSLWFVYDQNDLGVNLYRIDGTFVGYYAGEGDPYLEGVEFSPDNEIISLRYSGRTNPVFFNISDDL
jgi:hypothetical protein